MVSGIFYLVLKDIDIVDKEKVEKKKYFNEYKEILKNKRFVLFMIFYGVMMELIFINNNFFPTYLETRGIDSDGYGLVYAYCVVTELIMLLVFTKVKIKTSPFTLLIISCVSLVARIIPCLLDAPVWIVIVLAGLRGIGYAILLHVSYQYVVSLLGEDKATKGIMLATLIYSILLFIFNNINGILIEKYNYKTFYAIVLVASCVLLMYSILLYLYNKNHLSSNSTIEESKNDV